MIKDTLLPELTQEAAMTRKFLVLVPMEKFSWKPHEKSMTLGALATHIATLHDWADTFLLNDELDFAHYKYAPPTFKTNEEMLNAFDERIARAKKLLENTTDEDFAKIWTAKRGEHVVVAMPKAAVLRSWLFNHLVHHRAQLGVYLRLLDIPIPGAYGPSADEQ